MSTLSITQDETKRKQAQLCHEQATVVETVRLSQAARSLSDYALKISDLAQHLAQAPRKPHIVDLEHLDQGAQYLAAWAKKVAEIANEQASQQPTRSGERQP